MRAAIQRQTHRLYAPLQRVSPVHRRLTRIDAHQIIL
jgi:hypothetical protein